MSTLSKNPRRARLVAMTALGASALLLASCASGTDAEPEPAASVDPAAVEGTVVVYGSTSEEKLAPIFDAFEAKYDGVTVEYNDLSSTTIFNRVLSEGSAGGATADLAFSSAPDLFANLITQGMAQQYASPEAAAYPETAIYDDTLYTLRLEPLCQAYNTTAITEEQLPATHDDIARVIEEYPDAYNNRIGGYDIETSGVGYLIAFVSAEVFPGFWDTADAIGTTSPQFESSASLIVEKVQSGELNFGYNMPCSVVTPAAAASDNVGIKYDDEQVLALPTVGFVTKGAQNPDGGKALLDFMLSVEGQTEIAAVPSWFSAREDVVGEGFDKETYADVLAPMEMTEEFVGIYENSLTPTVRSEFLDSWSAAIAGTQ